MNAELKAKELVDKYLNEFLDDSGCGWTEKCASICAKICVQEIMTSMEEVMPNPPFQQYWQEVLNHLNEM